jgi:hypothetical protein
MWTSAQICTAGCAHLKIILIKIKLHRKCTFRLISCRMSSTLSRWPYTGRIFKFWATFTVKYRKTANTLVMFEDTLNEDLINGGWFLLQAFYFLWQSFEIMFDGTRNPPSKTQRVNWQEHCHKRIQRGHFHQAYHVSFLSSICQK